MVQVRDCIESTEREARSGAGADTKKIVRTPRIFLLHCTLTFRGGRLTFDPMRGIVRLLICLVLVVGTVFSGHASHGAVGEDPVSPGAYSHSDTPDFPDTADHQCSGEPCGEEPAPLACVSATGHCALALPGAARDAMAALLSMQFRRRFDGDQRAPHRSPETETPPPRV